MLLILGIRIQPGRRNTREWSSSDLFVDESGVPRNVHVVRPLGMGLDDNAVDAVRRYRFEPSTFQGKPVPVEIDVEVNFRLY